jgi:uncharacterized protein (DUF1697 family)
MARYVALLRGINVGKAKRVSMADLRALLEDLGHTDVGTVLMSGNAVFTSPSRNAAALAKSIEQAIAERLSMDVKVFVRTEAAVRKAADDVPWPELAVKDPSRLGIAFFDEDIDRKGLKPILDVDWSPERFAVGDRVTYAWQPNGVTGSPLAEALTKRKGGPLGTARNLATVRKVLDRAASAS